MLDAFNILSLAAAALSQHPSRPKPSRDKLERGTSRHPPHAFLPCVRAPVKIIADPERRYRSTPLVIQNGRVVRMSKEGPRSDFSATFLGLTTFSAAVHTQVFQRVDELIRAGRVDESYNDVIQQLAAEGLHVGYSGTEGLPWAQVDDPR